MTSAYFRKKPILSRCITVFLAFLLFVLPMSACSNSQTKSEKAQSAVVTIRTPSAEKIEVPFDKVSSIALLDDRLVVAGTSGGAPHVALTDLNGNILLEVKDIGTAIGQAYIYGLTSEKDGFALLLGDKSTSMQPDNIAYTLVQYTDSGEPVEALQLQNVPNAFLLGIIATPKGEYICWDMDGIYIFDQSGNLRTENAVSDCELISLLNTGDKIFATVCKDNGSGVCSLDPQTGNLGETYICDGLDVQFTVCSGSEETLAINSFSALYAFDIAESSFTKQFNWTGTSLKGTDISCLVLIGDNKYMCVSSGELFAVTIEQETAQREKIVVGFVSGECGSDNSTINAFVDYFNKNSDRYYAEVKEYKYSEIQRLKTELVTGTSPDVLEVSMVSMDMDLSSDYYVDLLPYIDSDSGLSRDALVESVLESIITDGRLTSIPASFYIETVTGRTKDVGSVPGWTMSELNSALEAKGSDCVAFPGWLTAKELMLWVSTLSMGEFVDWSSMTCSFTDEDFISLLNFCKSMPKEFNTNAYTSDYEENILLTLGGIQGLQRLEPQKMNYNGDNFTYIGFPNSSGNNGSYFSAPYENLQLAIPEQTKNKDRAWAFVREMMSVGYQSTIDLGLPILKSELMLRLDEQLNVPDTILTQEDADKFLELLNNTEIFLYGDSSIRNIILEEAIGFFENVKTADEVAELIQSRVSIYLAEKAD